MEPKSRFDAINMSKIRVDGVGGLGLVAMAGVVAVFMPAIGFPMAAGILGGVVLAIGIVVARRHLTPKGPSGQIRRLLFRAVPPEGGNYQERERRPLFDRPRTAGRERLGGLIETALRPPTSDLRRLATVPCPSSSCAAPWRRSSLRASASIRPRSSCCVAWNACSACSLRIALEARRGQHAGGDRGDDGAAGLGGVAAVAEAAAARRAPRCRRTRRRPVSPVSHSCSSRMPGVSIRMPPPGSSTS